MVTFASERGRERYDFCNRLSNRKNLGAPRTAFFALFPVVNPAAGADDDTVRDCFRQPENDMPPDHAFASVICFAAAIAAAARPAMAQGCSHDGAVVNCDDGRRGLLSGDAIIWADGTRSSASPHSSVIFGNKPSVHVGQGVFVGKGNRMVALDDSSAPNKRRCAVLNDVSYCY
jgi:hypothetical protein